MALSWLWAKSAGSPQNDYAGMDFGGSSVAADPAGNSYVTGTIGGAVTFGTIALTAASYPAVFVAKYNPAGVCLWAKAFGGNDPDMYGNQGKAVDLDSAGNCYVTGTFHGALGTTVTLAPGITLAGTGARQIFLIKFNSAGTPLWARQPTGAASLNNYAKAIATDPAGNSVITGYAGQAGVIFGSTAALSNFGAYVVKYDANGTALWTTKAGSSGNADGTSIALSPNGTCYVTGFLAGNEVFGSTSLTCIGVKDIFLCALSATGALSWAKSYGWAGTIAFGTGVSSAGTDVFLTGRFATKIVFGSVTLIAGGATASEAFLVKFDSAGNVIWARQSTNSSANTQGSAVKAVSGGECYVTGYFVSNTSIHFGSFALPSNGFGCVYVVRYGATGNPLWAMSSKNLNTGEIPQGISVDGLFFVYIAGLIYGPATFGAHTLPYHGGMDAFIAKIGDPSRQ